MAYTVVFSSDAKKDLKELQKKAPMAVAKLAQLLAEVVEHPRSGTGQCERLKDAKGKSARGRRKTDSIAMRPKQWVFNPKAHLGYLRWIYSNMVRNNEICGLHPPSPLRIRVKYIEN